MTSTSDTDRDIDDEGLTGTRHVYTYRHRKSDWIVALAMLVAGSVPAALIGVFSGWSVWSAVGAALVFWPCAIIGGAVATRGETTHLN